MFFLRLNRRTDSSTLNPLWGAAKLPLRVLQRDFSQLVLCPPALSLLSTRRGFPPGWRYVHNASCRGKALAILKGGEGWRRASAGVRSKSPFFDPAGGRTSVFPFLFFFFYGYRCMSSRGC